MAYKMNSTGSSFDHTAGLFYQARLIELMSIMRRAGHRDDGVPDGSGADHRAQQYPLIRRWENSHIAPVFHMALKPSGWWEIRERNGRRAGLFRTRQAAIKYVRDESPNGQFVIIDDVR